MDQLQLKKSQFDNQKINGFLQEHLTTAHLISTQPDAFTSGLTTLDDQHMCILEAIHELGKILGQNSENAQDIKAQFIKLQDYSNRHFIFEEQLMHESNYSGMKFHKARHENYMHAIEQLHNRYFYEKQDLKELCSILLSWFVIHISKEDYRFGKYYSELKNKSVN